MGDNPGRVERLGLGWAGHAGAAGDSSGCGERPDLCPGQMTVRVLRSTAQRVRALAAEADELEVEITRPERGVAC
jgi:hypothetical protein